MSDVELIASYWTFAGGALPHSEAEYSTFEFKERCEAIARAGFKGIGLWHADIEHVLKRYTLPQMKRILDDNGLKHVEVEFLADWFLPPGERRTASDERREFLFRACEGLGARHLKVGDFFKSDCSMERLIDEFGSLCRAAAPRGIRIGYELMPFSVIETLEKTRRLVEGAAQKNGGVIFDLWHIVKLGIPYDEVMRFPAPTSWDSRSMTATAKRRRAWTWSRRPPRTASCAGSENSTSKVSRPSCPTRPTGGRLVSRCSPRSCAPGRSRRRQRRRSTPHGRNFHE
jgi:hypothetical protein